MKRRGVYEADLPASSWRIATTPLIPHAFQLRHRDSGEDECRTRIVRRRPGRRGASSRPRRAIGRRGNRLQPTLDRIWKIAHSVPAFSLEFFKVSRFILAFMDKNATLYDLAGDEVLPSVSTSVLELPPADTKRWVARRKAVVVGAVRSGAITLEEACRRYELSVEEFLAWQRAIESHGVAGLRVTRLQIYRDTPPARLAKPRY